MKFVSRTKTKFSPATSEEMRNAVGVNSNMGRGNEMRPNAIDLHINGWIKVRQTILPGSSSGRSLENVMVSLKQCRKIGLGLV